MGLPWEQAPPAERGHASTESIATPTLSQWAALWLTGQGNESRCGFHGRSARMISTLLSTRAQTLDRLWIHRAMALASPRRLTSIRPPMALEFSRCTLFILRARRAI